MGSFSPPLRGSFQSEEIAILQQAFEAVWTDVVTHRPSQADNAELKALVSEKLCAIAAAGVMDSEQLRSMTLASLDYHPIATE
jgi:hypothetical protein